jgi:acetoin utilization protein AcuB
MSIHLVGLNSPATVRMAGVRRFCGVREVRGEINPVGDADHDSFRLARVDCQLGVDPFDGEMCLACPRLLGWRAGPGPAEVTVRCRWTHTDRVGSRMTAVRALVTVGPEARAGSVARLAELEGVHRILVLERGRLIGVVCGCDLDAADPDEPVCDVMASEVFAIDQGASLGEAAAAMSALDIGCLPVLRGSWLAGILTRGDLERLGLPAAGDE